MARSYGIELAATAFAALRRITDRKVVSELGEAIDRLARGPDVQGKQLVAPLDGVWSVRAARDRYRILYAIDTKRRRVTVLFVGRRRPGEAADVYRLAARLLHALTS